MNLADLRTMGYAVYALKNLFACPSNVRSNDKRTPEAVMSMALSIHAHGGLLQNLVVVPEIKDGKRTGRAAVSAGETRRQALCLLRRASSYLSRAGRWCSGPGGEHTANRARRGRRARWPRLRRREVGACGAQPLASSQQPRHTHSRPLTVQD